MTYQWRDNTTQSGQPCNVDYLNENLMHLKYEHIPPQDIRVCYSVNSGKQDTYGYAGFILKNTNTQVTVLAGGSNPDLMLTYPDGTSEILSSNMVISSGLSSNGTYIIVKEKGNNTPVLISGSNTITESILDASGGLNGDYWLNIGIKPYFPRKRVSGNWTPQQFVKLGEVYKNGSGVIETVTSYAFNGRFISQAQTITNGVNVTVNHNIGVDPLRTKGQVLAKCLSAELNYSIGDVVNLTGYGPSSSWEATTPILTSKTIGFTPGGTASTIVDKSTGYISNPSPITNNKWAVYLIAERGF